MGHQIETGTDTVRIEVEGRVAVMTFNRPERRNALHGDMYEPMIAAVKDFAKDPQIGCVVVTGEGSSFCAGGDVKGGRSGNADSAEGAKSAGPDMTVMTMLPRILHEAPVVTIAAVNGPAVGAGLSIAMACDLRIAAASASFTGGWARLGFSGDLGGAWFLTQLMGHSRTLEFLVTNEKMDMATAERLGLVNKVVADEVFPTAWRAYAEQMASGAFPGTGLAKSNVRDALVMSLEQYLPIESGRMAESAQSDDHREAVKAWLQKRPPVFGKKREN